MLRRRPRSTRVRSSAASDVYKRQAEHRTGARELRVIADHQHQFAVGAAEYAGGHAAIAPGAAPRRRLAVDEIDLGVMRQGGDHGVEQADIDILPLPAIGVAM